MATPSKRFRNWTSVAMGGVAGDGIKDISIDYGIQDVRDGADADRGPTHGVVVFEQQTINVQTTNAMLWIAFGHGPRGIFTATWNDSYNGALTSSGAYVITTNALSYIGGRQQSGGYNQLGTQTVNIHTVWSDGVTNPISITPA